MKKGTMRLRQITSAFEKAEEIPSHPKRYEMALIDINKNNNIVKKHSNFKLFKNNICLLVTYKNIEAMANSEV